MRDQGAGSETTGESPSGYLWDSTLAEEKARLDAQAEIWDPYSARYLGALGLRPGWRCLEVGAGSGTMTRYIADRVSPEGSVIATDVDVRFLAALQHPAVAIREHNLTTDDLEEDAFDLVFCRMVLMHLPNGDEHLGKLARAVRPGGWLLVQDVDLAFNESKFAAPFAWPASTHRLGAKTMKSLNGLLAMTGATASFARTHPQRLISLGFKDVGAEMVNRMIWGAEDGPYRMAFERVMSYLVQYAGLSEAEVQRRLGQLSDRNVSFSSGPMVSAWGRRPMSVSAV